MQPQQVHSVTLGESAAARPLRPLLPAFAPRTEPRPKQSKRSRISLACAACRTRKTKCNGERPQCSECASRDSHCQYKETEITQTKRRHHDLEQLFELLKSLPYEDAAEALGRIRAGAEPRDIVETITHGNMLMQIASTFRRKKHCTNGSIDTSEEWSGSESGNGNEHEETESGTGSRSSEEPKTILDAQPGGAAEKSTAMPLDRMLLSDPEDY